MTAAGVDWQLHVYAEARHGFTVPDVDPAKHPGCAYHGRSDRRSSRAMLALFEEAFGAGDPDDRAGHEVGRGEAVGDPSRRSG